MTGTPRGIGNSTRIASGFIAASLVIYACKMAQDIIIPFVVAVFIWYLINAIARFAGLLRFGPERLEIPRFWRFVVGIATLCVGMIVIFELVHHNVGDVSAAAPKFQASFEKIANQAAVVLQLDHAPSVKEVMDEVLKNYVDIGAAIRAFAGMLTGMAGKTLVVFFFVGFLLYEQQFFDRKLKFIIRDAEAETRVRQVLSAIDIKIQRYIGVKSFVSFVDSVLTFVILSAFGVDFAGFWGVMAFFLHFIPYAGSFVAISMPVLISLIQFGDLSVFLMVFASLATSHAFLGHVLDPYLMGNNLNLSPIVIMTNLALWGMVWGVPGMFLAIPILAIVTITLSQFESTRPLAVLFSKTGVIETRRRKLKKL